MLERSLILLKPDTVQRGLMGRILCRFEDVGLKIVGCKMVWVDKDHAAAHYADVAQRRGEKVFDQNVRFLTEGPVLAIVVEGIHAIDQVRKMIGPTEPKSALPGTIRGDFTHQSFAYADVHDQVIRNLVHASSSQEDAQREIPLWFTPEEVHTYTSVHDRHVLGK